MPILDLTYALENTFGYIDDNHIHNISVFTIFINLLDLKKLLYKRV